METLFDLKLLVYRRRLAENI